MCTPWETLHNRRCQSTIVNKYSLPWWISLSASSWLVIPFTISFLLSFPNTENTRTNTVSLSCVFNKGPAERVGDSIPSWEGGEGGCVFWMGSGRTFEITLTFLKHLLVRKAAFLKTSKNTNTHATFRNFASLFCLKPDQVRLFSFLYSRELVNTYVSQITFYLSHAS